MEYPNGGKYNGSYNAVILEKGERSRVVRSYDDVTGEDVKIPLGQNRLIISYIIYFIKVYLHWVTPGNFWLHKFSQRHLFPRLNQLFQYNLGKLPTIRVKQPVKWEGLTWRTRIRSHWMRKKKEKDSADGTPLGWKIFMGQVKHSTCSS